MAPPPYHSLSKKSDSPYHAIDPASQSNVSWTIISVLGSSVDVLGRATDDFVAHYRNPSFIGLLVCQWTCFTVALDFKVEDFTGCDAAMEHKIQNYQLKLNQESSTSSLFRR